MEFKDFLSDLIEPSIRKEVRETFVDLGKIASGDTLDSLEVNRIDRAGSLVWEIEIGGAAEYIESGRSAGAAFPPISAIKEWMDEVGITDVPAFVIARAISIKGIEPVNLSQEILDRVNNRVLFHLRSEAITNFIDSKFKDNT